MSLSRSKSECWHGTCCRHLAAKSARAGPERALTEWLNVGHGAPAGFNTERAAGLSGTWVRDLAPALAGQSPELTLAALRPLRRATRPAGGFAVARAQVGNPA